MSWTVALPEALIGLGALAATFMPAPQRNRRGVQIPVVFGALLAVAWIAELSAGAATGTAFDGGFVQDRLALYAKSFLILAALLGVVLADWEIADRSEREVSLLLWACFGGLVAASAGSLAELWAGCLLAVVAALAALGAYPRLLLAAAATMLLAGLGFAYVYAFAGQSDLTGIAARLPDGVTTGSLVVAAVVAITGLGGIFVSAGLIVRGAGAWPADASVAAAPIAGLAAGTGAVALLRFDGALVGSAAGWSPLLAVFAAVALLAGAAGALGARSIRGLVGWLTLAQGGWILAGLAAHGRFAVAGSLFLLGIFLVAYCGLSSLLGEDLLDRLPALAGHGTRAPAAAAAIAVALLSLAGAPPFGGWFGEFSVAAALVQGGYYWLLFVGLGSGLLALAAVGRVLAMIFLSDPAEGTVTVLNSIRVAASVALVAVVIGFALFANPLHGLAMQGAEGLQLP
ncbi:MAG TPA: proton-conducting transporter membrane subunit [Candidatus Dormibacteraeota bacterium]